MITNQTQKLVSGYRKGGNEGKSYNYAKITMSGKSIFLCACNLKISPLNSKTWASVQS